jgi:hypothetical protein
MRLFNPSIVICTAAVFGIFAPLSAAEWTPFTSLGQDVSVS